MQCCFSLSIFTIVFIILSLSVNAEQTTLDDQTINSDVLFEKPINFQNSITKDIKSWNKFTNQSNLIIADQIVHDRDFNTVTARGHVEIDHDGNILLADVISYNLKLDIITATGNVSITEKTGDVVFADYVELTGDMKNVVAKRIRVLMSNNARIAANAGNYIASDRSVFDKGVYTICNLCSNDIGKPPLWQVKANRITHNDKEHIIEYDDAWLEFGGVPIAYTPYLSHVDHTINSKSGILYPTFISNNVIGTGIRIPYFYVINSHQDIVLTPMYSQNKKKNYEQLAIKHRWRNNHGCTSTGISVANIQKSAVEKKNTIGWHIDAYSRFDLNNTWRSGYTIQRASNRYYLPIFDYRPLQPYMTIHPYLEYLSYRDYAGIEAYSFQSIIAPFDITTMSAPTVLPLITYSHVGDPSRTGSYWNFDIRSMAVTREKGVNSRNINVVTAWNLPHTSPNGVIYKLSTILRTDVYNSDHVITNNKKQINSGSVIPIGLLDLQYPFTKVDELSSQILSPIIVATISPNRNLKTRNFKTFNEDSNFELDNTNIFKPLSGIGSNYDLTGPKVAYGGQYTIANHGFGSANFVLGQLYQVHPEKRFYKNSEIDHNFSDIVGQVGILPVSNFSMHYGFKLDKTNMKLRHCELIASIGPQSFNLQTSYVFSNRYNNYINEKEREQINGILSKKISNYWSGQFYTTQNIGAKYKISSSINTGVRLIYEDECFSAITDVGSNRVTINNVRMGYCVMFQLNFKTLAKFNVHA